MKPYISKTEVYGFDESTIASGYAMATDVEPLWVQGHNKRISRSARLGSTKMGEGHDNFLKGIIVQADFTLAGRVWTQALRYNWFEIVSSQSTMHRILQFDIKEQCSDNVDPIIIHRLERIVAEYTENPTPENFERVIDNIPNGLLLTARVTTNYRQLKTMFNQRKTHRLHFWNSTFVDWCKSLPYFCELTGCH